MDDTKILDLYFARDEQALTETDKKYGRYCFTLANSILANSQDAEEAVSDTYLKTWNAIPPQRPQVLKMFLAKIVRNLSFSRWRSRTADKRGGGEIALTLEELEACIPCRENPEDTVDARELAAAIRTFLETLPGREQGIFLRRYFFLEESSAIAQRYAMGQGTVLKSLSRTRSKLRRFLIQEGYAL